MTSPAATHIPPAARFLPKNVFYGWYIAGGWGGLLFVGVRGVYYGVAVFLGPLKDEHGWSTTAVSGATGLYFSVSGLTSALVGGRIDRSGPTRFLIVGIVLMGVRAGA